MVITALYHINFIFRGSARLSSAAHGSFQDNHTTFVICIQKFRYHIQTEHYDNFSKHASIPITVNMIKNLAV